MPSLISVSVAGSTTATSSHEYVASVETKVFSAPVLPGNVFFVPNSQAYYWTPEWQAFEKQADADIAAGRIEQFTSMNDAIVALRSPE